MKKNLQLHTQTLVIPNAMTRMETDLKESILGGKRREGSITWKLAYGLTASLLIGPAGFLLVFL